MNIDPQLKKFPSRNLIATLLQPRQEFSSLTYEFLEADYDSRMVRKLKHHEQKLLRKVDFTTYKSDNNHRDAAVIRRYMIQKPGD